MWRTWAGLAALLAVVSPALAAPAAGRDAQIDRLRRALLAGPSASVVLTKWCADHHLAEPPRLIALRQRDFVRPADAAIRAALAARPGERILYRRVNLVCGAHLLSRADNWYRPGLLTAGMNRRLETTDTPFGLVVAPLNFHRRLVGVDRPDDPSAVLGVRAVLISGRGQPFSLVRETYTDELLAKP